MSSIRRIQPASKFDPLFRRGGYAAVLRMAVPVISIPSFYTFCFAIFPEAQFA